MIPKKQKILITGSGGFVGRALSQRLLTEGWNVRTLGHPHTPDVAVLNVEGDVFHSRSVEDAMEGIHTVYHLAGITHELPAKGITFESIHVEGTKNVVAAAKQAGVKRIIMLSTLGARATAATRYHLTKWTAEQTVRESGIPFVIHRPSVIIGKNDNFVCRLEKLARNLPVLPIITRGDTRFRPIALSNMVEALMRSLTDMHLEGKTIEEGGPEVVTFNEIALMVLEVAAQRKPIVNVPIWIGRLAAPWAERLHRPPFTLEELIVRLEGSNTSIEEFQRLIPMTLLPLRSAIEEALLNE